jgi:hypothetical protein
MCGKDVHSRRLVTQAGRRRRVIVRVPAWHAAAVQGKACELLKLHVRSKQDTVALCNICFRMEIIHILTAVFSRVRCLADAAAPPVHAFVLAPPRIALVAGVRMYCCSACSYQSNDKSHYNVHARTHTGERPFACDLCGFSCSQSGSLKVHMRRHTGEKPFACEECSYICDQRSHMKRHMRTHTGEKPFVCSVCQSAFTTASYLKIHMRTHTGEKPYICTVCEASFATSSNLSKHVRIHLRYILPWGTYTHHMHIHTHFDKSCWMNFGV